MWRLLQPIGRENKTVKACKRVYGISFLNQKRLKVSFSVCSLLLSGGLFLYPLQHIQLGVFSISLLMVINGKKLLRFTRDVVKLYLIFLHSFLRFIICSGVCLIPSSFYRLPCYCFVVCCFLHICFACFLDYHVSRYCHCYPLFYYCPISTL